MESLRQRTTQLVAILLIRTELLIHMKSFKQTYVIKAPLEKVWQAFFDPRIIEAWGAGPAIMSEREDAGFSLWGGDIHGKNTRIVKEKELVQTWYGGPWSEPSKVTFSFSSDGNSTTVELFHENLPDSEASNFEKGWKDYYLGAIKELLER